VIKDTWKQKNMKECDKQKSIVHILNFIEGEFHLSSNKSTN